MSRCGRDQRPSSASQAPIPRPKCLNGTAPITMIPSPLTPLLQDRMRANQILVDPRALPPRPRPGTGSLPAAAKVRRTHRRARASADPPNSLVSRGIFAFPLPFRTPDEAVNHVAAVARASAAAQGLTPIDAVRTPPCRRRIGRRLTPVAVPRARRARHVRSQEMDAAAGRPGRRPAPQGARWADRREHRGQRGAEEAAECYILQDAFETLAGIAAASEAELVAASLDRKSARRVRRFFDEVVEDVGEVERDVGEVEMQM
ncbi:hypothetical protein DFJ74DRAFT_505155 [Hyaloraphidium curvatum]|nr:hypothetical protein DFJ74DRAFT_505155 [Hyaloraphidium curvatum]